MYLPQTTKTDTTFRFQGTGTFFSHGTKQGKNSRSLQGGDTALRSPSLGRGILRAMKAVHQAVAQLHVGGLSLPVSSDASESNLRHSRSFRRGPAPFGIMMVTALAPSTRSGFLPDDGLLFHDLIREGLPTMRSLSAKTPRSFEIKLDCQHLGKRGTAEIVHAITMASTEAAWH